jgi:hypothetical protein
VSALEHKRTASRYYREGRKWARHAKEWAQAARDTEVSLSKAEPEDVEFYTSQLSSWERLAASAASWTEECRRQARFYRGLQRDAAKREAA